MLKGYLSVAANRLTDKKAHKQNALKRRQMGLLWIMTGISPKPVLCNLIFKCGFSDYDP